MRRDDLAAVAGEPRRDPDGAGTVRPHERRSRALPAARPHPGCAGVQLVESRYGRAGALLRAADGRTEPGAAAGAEERRAARDRGRAGGAARASRAAADGVRLPAPRASEAGEAQVAPDLPQGHTRSERGQHPAWHVDLARSGKAVSAALVMSDQEIYLDYAATSPVDPAVTAAMLECLTHEFGNPSSQHAAGRRARRLVEAARAAVAVRVGAAPERLLFTSGATEANNLALQGVLRRPHKA